MSVAGERLRYLGELAIDEIVKHGIKPGRLGRVVDRGDPARMIEIGRQARRLVEAGITDTDQVHAVLHAWIDLVEEYEDETPGTRAAIEDLCAAMDAITATDVRRRT